MVRVQILLKRQRQLEKGRVVEDKVLKLDFEGEWDDYDDHRAFLKGVIAEYPEWTPIMYGPIPEEGS